MRANKAGASCYEYVFLKVHLVLSLYLQWNLLLRKCAQ
jgi:hypothetical protein